MSKMGETEPRFPLGEPVNRKPTPGLTLITGRPNWYQPRSGEPVYIEPAKPPVVLQPWAPELWRRTMKP